MKFQIVFVLISLFFCQTAVLASVSTSGNWVGIMPTYQLDETHSFTLQAEARRQGNNSFSLIRPSYHFQVDKVLNFGLGGDVFTTDQTESRYWAEFNLKTAHKILNQILHFRFRQEFRSLSGVESSGARSRAMLMSQFDLYRPYCLEVFVFDEVFYTQRSFNGEKNFFDRNWLGLRIRKNKGQAFYDLGGFWEKVFSSPDTDGFVGILSVGYLFK